MNKRNPNFILAILLSISFICSPLNGYTTSVDPLESKQEFLEKMTDLPQDVQIELSENYKNLSIEKRELILLIVEYPEKVMHPVILEPQVLESFVTAVIEEAEEEVIKKQLQLAKQE